MSWAPAAAPTAAPAAPLPEWARVRRLLAVRLDNLGDLLMTTPALAALRESLPRAQITLLTSPAGVAAAPHLRMIDAALGFAAPWCRPDDAVLPAARLGRAEAALVDRLAHEAFDAAVIFTVCTQSALPAALLCRLAGIPLVLAHCRENPYALLSHGVPERDEVVAGATHDAQHRLARHEVRRQLELVAHVGMVTADDRLRFDLRPDDRRRVRQRLAAVGLAPDGAYAVLHPGATAASRRWHAVGFGHVARRLVDAGCAVVLNGTREEEALIHEVQQAMAPARAVPLQAALGLGESAALIEGARVVVTNNSAPAHLAAAVGTPLVELYALTNPQHAPWRARARVLYHDVPCRWCLRSVCPHGHHDCLRRVDASEVIDAALHLIQQGRRRFVAPAAAPPGQSSAGGTA